MNLYIIITKSVVFVCTYVVRANHGNRARAIVAENMGTNERIVDAAMIARDEVGDEDLVFVSAIELKGGSQ